MPDPNCPDSTVSEAELAAYLYWYWQSDGGLVAARTVELLRAHASRRLRSWLSREALTGLSQEAARLLCRAYIHCAVAEFTAWTPLAQDVRAR